MISKNILQFLIELKMNNNREWFHDHKQRYEEIQKELIAFTGSLLSEMERFDQTLRGTSPKDCLFRIYKDVRFSKDKSPYKTNLGIFIKGGGKKSPGAGYYFHIEPHQSLLGGGCYEPDPKSLYKIRETILRNPSALKKIILAKPYIKEFGTEFYGDKLKTAPKGFQKDHPDIELIKYKSYAAIKKLKDSELTSKSMFPETLQSFKTVFGLNQFLNHILL